MRDDFGIKNIVPIKVGLTAEQVRRFKLPPKLKAKIDSPNHNRFVDEFGDDVWELEAARPELLQDALRSVIDKVIDREAFNRELSQEKDDATKLQGTRQVFRKFALDQVGDKGANLLVCDSPMGELNLDTAVGQAWVAMLAMVRHLWVEQIKTSTSEALRWRAANGQFMGREQCPPGRRVVPDPSGRKTVRDRPVRILVWDDKQCQLVREVWARVGAGESFHSIAMDWVARDERDGLGTPWVVLRFKSGKSETYRLLAVWRWYRDLLAQGKDLGNFENWKSRSIGRGFGPSS